MTLLLKDPAAALDYAVDWGVDYLTDDTLAQSSWEVSPAETGGLSVVASSFDQKIASVLTASSSGYAFSMNIERGRFSSPRGQRPSEHSVRM